MRHAVIVTAGEVDPDGDAAEVSTEAFGELGFVNDRARALLKLLEHEQLGYVVEHFAEAGCDDLRRVDDALEAETGLLHFLGHGFVRSGALHFVPATGGFGRPTNVVDLCAELNARSAAEGRQYLLVLDLCSAERGLRGRALGDIQRVWVACASGDQRAYNGWFTQALAETLKDLSNGAIDIDSSFEFMPMSRFRDEVGQRYGRILDAHGRESAQRPDAYFLGRFTNESEARSDRVPFFSNPHFDPGTAAEGAARTAMEANLHPFLDAPHFADRAGPHFTGRSSILTELGEWRTGRRPETALAIVTGAAGSGKSAIAAAIVLTCHPEILASSTYAEPARVLRARLPTSCRIGVLGPVAAVHARHRRLDEVTRGFIEQLHGQGNPKLDREQVSSTADLVDWVCLQTEPPLLILDALDEANKSDDLVHVLLRPLLAARRDGRPACRLLIAGRSDAALELLEQTALAPLRFNLDDQAPAELALDLEAFLTEAFQTGNRCCRDRVTRLAAAVARTLVNHDDGGEYGPFLVASLYANYLGRLTHQGADVDEHLPSDPIGAAARLPRSIAELLDLDFRRLDDPDECRRRRSVLAALAYARGQGMPAAVAGMLATTMFEGNDLDATAILRDSAGIKVYLRSTTDSANGAPLYRLFHQGLEDYLRQQPSIVQCEADGIGTVDWDRKIYEALSDDAAITGWDSADPYLKRHVAEHAAAAGQLAALMPQPGFLSNADPNTLVPILRAPLDGSSQLLSAAFRAGIDVHRNPSHERSRAQRLLLDLIRAGASGNCVSDSRQLWQPQWCVGSKLHPAQLDILTGHTAAVAAVAFGELDGHPVALTGSDDRTARIWDLRNGNVLAVLSGHSSSIAAVALGELDGELIAVTGSYDGTARVWNARTGAELTVLACDTDVMYAVTIGEIDGSKIVLTGSRDNMARVWDLQTATVLRVLTGHSGLVGAVAFGALDGRPIALTGSNDGSARVWDASTGASLMAISGHSGEIQSVALGKVDGQPVALTGSLDGTARLWDLNTGAEQLAFTGHDGLLPGVTSVAFGEFKDRPIVVTGSYDDTARVWDASTGAELRVFSNGTAAMAAVTTVALGKVDGQPVALTGSLDGTARLWDLNTGPKPVTRTALDGYAPILRAVAFGEVDGRPITLTTSRDNTVRMRSAETGKELTVLVGHTRAVASVVVGDLDGRSVALTGSWDHTARLWDLRTGAELTVFDIGDRALAPVALGELDGRPVALTGAPGGTARVWDLHTGTTITVLTTPSDVVAVGFGRLDDRTVVLTGSENGNAQVWDATTGSILIEHINHSSPISHVAFNTGDRLIALTATDDGGAQILDLNTGTELAVLTGHTGPVVAAAFGDVDDHPFVVTGSWDNTVRVWDANTGAEIDRLDFPSPVTGLALGPGSRLLVAYGPEFTSFDPPQYFRVGT